MSTCILNPTSICHEMYDKCNPFHNSNDTDHKNDNNPLYIVVTKCLVVANNLTLE